MLIMSYGLTSPVRTGTQTPSVTALAVCFVRWLKQSSDGPELDQHILVAMVLQCFAVRFLEHAKCSDSSTSWNTLSFANNMHFTSVFECVSSCTANCSSLIACTISWKLPERFGLQEECGTIFFRDLGFWLCKVLFETDLPCCGSFHVWWCDHEHTCYPCALCSAWSVMSYPVRCKSSLWIRLSD